MQFKIFTPTEYAVFINEGLHDYAAVVEGEVSEYRINQGKWIFFKIKDENSVLDCFSTTFQLKSPLEDGMKVRLYGIPKIYPKSGKFSLSVQWAEASGEGSLKRAFELMKAELEKEGIFSLSRKREIPKFPKRIGIIASKESAAYKDFLKVLSQRFGGMELYLYNVAVQGENSIIEIVEAFKYFNDSKDKLNLDMIILTRGGGSLEDLKSFNSKEVAYAVFSSSVPVVCGVGHEQDISLADYAADIRASTPSNAAELISQQRSDILMHMNNEVYKIESNLNRLVMSSNSDIERFTRLLDGFISGQINAFANLQSRLFNGLKNFEEILIMQRSRIDVFLRLLNSLNPREVLKRGYSIVKFNGRIILSIRNIKKKDTVNISLSDGDINAQVL
ncbi:MAG: exodeoxyribonuclease VII large subunit [Patescibacteria group bacterium]